MCRILGSDACHHLKCNLRSSFCTTAASYERRFLKLSCTLNLLQSGKLVSFARASVGFVGLSGAGVDDDAAVALGSQSGYSSREACAEVVPDVGWVFARRLGWSRG